MRYIGQLAAGGSVTMETRGKHGSSQLLLSMQQNPGDGPLAGLLRGSKMPLKKETNLVLKMFLKTTLVTKSLYSPSKHAGVKAITFT